MMYICVHLYYLGGVAGRRLSAGRDMVLSIFGSRESRVIDGELGSVDRPAPEGVSAANQHPATG
jgi:hypothetical protein